MASSQRWAAVPSAALEALDRIDHRLLDLLSKNARASKEELAAAVGLSASACHARLARLIRERHIRGFHANVDPAAFGVTLRAIVFVNLSRHEKSVIDPGGKDQRLCRVCHDHRQHDAALGRKYRERVARAARRARCGDEWY
jgi:DNA-binding Lrp family transcriptional regulator